MTPYLIAGGITAGAIICGIGIAWLLGHPPIPERWDWEGDDIPLTAPSHDYPINAGLVDSSVYTTRTGEVLNVVMVRPGAAIPIGPDGPILTERGRFLVALAEIGCEVEREVLPADALRGRLGRRPRLLHGQAVRHRR